MTLSQINRSAMSPLLAFPAIWALGALLSQVHLLNTQSAWSTIVVAVVCAVPISFVAGGLIGEWLALRSTPLARERAGIGAEARLVRIVLLVLVALGFAELIHQFIRTGQIPLLSGNIDAARFGQGGPTILLTDFLTVAAIVALTAPKDLFAREHRFELGIACAALGGFVLQAGRGTVLLPIGVALAARWIYWGRPRTSLLLGGGLLGLFVVSVFFFLRAEQHPTTPFEAELFTEVLPGMPFLLRPLVPLYFAITTNFLALQAIIGHFPTVAPFGHGVFDAYGINYFVASGRDLGEISNALTSPWVTSTVAGPLWADSGFPGVILGIALTGVLSAGAFVAARRTLSLRWSMIAAFLLYLAVFGVYTSLWTQHVDWLVITPALLVVGAVIEDPSAPPGVTGQALSRVSKRFARPSRPPSGRNRGPFWKLAGVGLAIVLALLAIGAIIQETLPEPIPRAATVDLPSSVATATAVMTESDRSQENAPLWWVNGHGRSATLHEYNPNFSPARTAATPIRLPGSFDHVHYAVGVWPPMREPALFVMNQEPNFLEILVESTSTGKPVGRFRAPLAAPLPGAHRDYFVATYSGIKPELYTIDRGSALSRVRVVAVSGESGFRRRLVNSYLGLRGAGPGEWATALAPVATQPVDEPPPRNVQPRPDLILIQHDAGNEHSIVRLLLGETGFEGFSAQRAMDTPGALPRRSAFLTGAWKGATSIYLVRTDRRGRSTLSVYPLQPTTGLY